MKYAHILATVFLVAVIFVESGLGIKCFECNSYHQQNCGDKFDNTTHNAIECKQQEMFCRKIVQEIEITKGEWQKRIIRQCAEDGDLGKDGKTCKDRIGTSGVKMKYCHCKGDGCNTASSSWNVPLTLMAGAIAGQYFWHKL